MQIHMGKQMIQWFHKVILMFHRRNL